MALTRNTYQKAIVFDIIEKNRNHPTADDVYQEVNKRCPSISRATVYRILNQLADQKHLLRIHIPGGADRYDSNPARHCHMQCTKCFKIIDFDIPALQEIGESLSRTHKFHIDDYHVVFSGLCNECKAEKENPT